MNIRFNIEKSQRRALAQKIGELTGSEVKYLGVPSCGYQIGAYILNKEAVLHVDELPDDIRSELQKAGYTAEDEPVRRVLLRRLTGSSAFRHGKPEGGADDAVSE